MCGVVDSVEKPFKDVGKLITHPSLKNLENVGHDVLPIAETVGLTALQAPFLGPAAFPAAAAETGAINTAARGGSLTQDFKSAALSGGLAYGGQQLSGAFGGAFPETSSAISNAIPDAPNLGIGDTVNSIEKSLGFGGGATPASSLTPGTSTGSPSLTTAAPASGGAGVSAAGASAPFGISVDTSGIDALAAGQGASGDSSTVGSSATSGSNVGSGTVGTQSLPSGISGNLNQEFAQAAGGAPSLSSPAIDSMAAGGGGGVSGGATASPSSVSQFLSHPSLSNAGNIITSNPGAAISAAGLGLDAIRGAHETGAEKNIQAEAGQLGQQGAALGSYLQSGTLPPGLQAGVNQATDAAKATIRSQYAARGMSGSSVEQQELAAVDQRAEAQGAQMAMQLLSTGIDETGMASGLYKSLLQQETQQDAQLGSAISNFASAAAGGGKGGQFTLTAG